jgi:transcriptional/translational regulatory protein YebC/TACO1
MAEAGAVAWQFESKGVITVEPDGMDADDIAMAAIDAGAEDVQVDDDSIEITTAPTDLEQVKRALEERKVPLGSAELAMVPNATVPVAEGDASQALRLLDRLEELDDVQRVYSNADFPDAVLAAFSG